MAPGTYADPREHIVAAATKVFTTEATRQVTLKRIALEARVRPETVTELWDSTADLLTAVFEQLTHDIASGWPDGRVPGHGGDLDDDQSEWADAIVNIVMRATIDGVDHTQITERHPIIDRLVEAAAATGVDYRTARYRVYQLLLLEFSYRAFSSHLLAACGLEREPGDCVRREVSALQLSLRHLPPVPAEG